MGHQGAGLFPNRQGDEEGEKERTLNTSASSWYRTGTEDRSGTSTRNDWVKLEQRDLWFLHSFAQSIFGLCVLNQGASCIKHELTNLSTFSPDRDNDMDWVWCVISRKWGPFKAETCPCSGRVTSGMLSSFASTWSIKLCSAQESLKVFKQWWIWLKPWVWVGRSYHSSCLPVSPHLHPIFCSHRTGANKTSLLQKVRGAQAVPRCIQTHLSPG